MTYPNDYSQQLYAYLQAWRQLLEPLLAAMTAGLAYPWASGAVPSHPSSYPPSFPSSYPVPPTAPPAPTSAQVPADYTQQLFGYLQSWRQYLEQVTGSAPPPPEPGHDDDSIAEESARRAHAPDQPDVGRGRTPKSAGSDTGSSTGSGSGVGTGTGTQRATFPPFDEARVERAPMLGPGSQVPRDDLAALRRETPAASTRVITGVSQLPHSTFAGLARRAQGDVRRG